MASLFFRAAHLLHSHEWLHASGVLIRNRNDETSSCLGGERKTSHIKAACAAERTWKGKHDAARGKGSPKDLSARSTTGTDLRSGALLLVFLGLAEVDVQGVLLLFANLKGEAARKNEAGQNNHNPNDVRREVQRANPCRPARAPAPQWAAGKARTAPEKRPRVVSAKEIPFYFAESKLLVLFYS